MGSAIKGLGSLLRAPWERALALAVGALICSLLYGFYNGTLWLTTGEVWFGAVCVYNLLLGAMRLAVVVSDRKDRPGSGGKAMAWTGGLLVVQSGVLLGMLLISLHQDRAVVHGTIPMITIATYTFSKLTLAIVKTAGKGKRTALEKTLQTIRLAEASVSILTMQRSMLASFGEREPRTERILNILAGAAVCVLLCLWGVRLLRQEKRKQVSA